MSDLELIFALRDEDWQHAATLLALRETSSLPLGEDARWHLAKAFNGLAKKRQGRPEKIDADSFLGAAVAIEYREMLAGGSQKSAAVSLLCERHGISRTKVYEILKLWP